MPNNEQRYTVFQMRAGYLVTQDVFCDTPDRAAQFESLLDAQLAARLVFGEELELVSIMPYKSERTREDQAWAT